MLFGSASSTTGERTFIIANKRARRYDGGFHSIVSEYGEI